MGTSRPRTVFGFDAALVKVRPAETTIE